MPPHRLPVRRGARVIVAVAATCVALSSLAGSAIATPPPGDATLYFSPSASGGCDTGVISGINEGSTSDPIVVSPSNTAFLQPPDGHYTASGLYAGGMAATPYAPGFGGIDAAQSSSLVYFANSCNGASQQLLVGCYTQFNGVPAVCGVPPAGGAPLAEPVWIAWAPPAGQSVGQGMAFDPVHNRLYFTSYSNCSGIQCQVNIWSAGSLSSYGAVLDANQVASLGSTARPDHLAVDPVTQRLFLMGANFNQVISISAVTGGGQTVVLPSGPLISAGVNGLAVDPSTAMVYVLSAQMGAEPNQIAQVAENGSGASSLFSGGSMGTDSASSGLAVDPIAGVAYWANVESGAHPAGSANSISWGPLDGTNATTYGWLGSVDGPQAPYVLSLTVANDVSPPTASVAAAGATAQGHSAGSVDIPLSSYLAASGGSPAEAGVSQVAARSMVSGRMVVTVRDRRAVHGAKRVYATLRPGFSVMANRHSVRRVTIPASALPALRSGRLEVQVTTRAAGASQWSRTRVLRVKAPLRRS